MKEADGESARSARLGLLDGSMKRRSLGNSKAGRGLLLGFVTMVCILLFSSRFLITFTSIFASEPSNSGPSQVKVHFPLFEHREATAQFDEALKEEDPFVKANATTGDDEADSEDELENSEAGDELQSVEETQSASKEEEPVEELQSVSKEDEPVEDNDNKSDDDDDAEVRDARADVEGRLDDDKKKTGDDEKKTAEDVEETLADSNLKGETRDSEESGAPVEEDAAPADEDGAQDGAPADEDGSQAEEDGAPVEEDGAHAEEEAAKEKGDEGEKVPDAIAYLARLATNLTKTDVEEDNGPYHNRRIFEMEYGEMKRRIRIFVYPYSSKDPFVNIYMPITRSPTGNYASEEFFQQALYRSGLVTEDANKADFFFMPVSITKARQDKRINVAGLKAFCAKYVTGVREHYGYWNRSNGADHFYLSCHSIARSAMDAVPYVRENAIQLLCPSSYYLSNYITHKDAAVPQIWPRPNIAPRELTKLQQRTRLAFFAGSANSPVRRELVRVWGNDDKILIHEGKVPYPYSKGLMTSKFCLQAKGFEVNTARLGDSMFYGCVPVVIADYYDLPWQDILDWTKFSIVVAHADIPLLKKILEEVSDKRYAELHKNVMLARKHFIWHNPAEEYDAFHTVMYELWKRRHIVRRPASQ